MMTWMNDQQRFPRQKQHIVVLFDKSKNRSEFDLTLLADTGIHLKSKFYLIINYLCEINWLVS
jgi:hypothetical protein